MSTGELRRRRRGFQAVQVDGGDGTPTFGWSGNIERNDKATFRAEYKVDYVRVYQLP